MKTKHNRKNNDIFDKTDYLNYLNNNNKITRCNLTNLYNYYNTKYTFFVNSNSNSQISTFFKNAFKTNNISQITKMQLLFMNFISFTSANKVITELRHNIHLTDEDIINYIKKNGSFVDLEKNKLEYDLCNGWTFALQNIVMIYNNLKKNKNNSYIKYLDIGCGNAKKTSMIYNYLNLKKQNTYCTDIQSWGPYQQKEKDKIPFQFKYIIGGKLDYPDDSFDFISCILTLHHIPDLAGFIKEIHRILKPGGFFLLIEHSLYTDYELLTVNIQHMFYSAFYDKKTDFINNPDYIYCYNMYEWNYILTNNKFKALYSSPLPFGNEYNIQYDNIFCGFYQK